MVVLGEEDADAGGGAPGVFAVEAEGLEDFAEGGAELETVEEGGLVGPGEAAEEDVGEDGGGFCRGGVVGCGDEGGFEGVAEGFCGSGVFGYEVGGELGEEVFASCEEGFEDGVQGEGFVGRG